MNGDELTTEQPDGGFAPEADEAQVFRRVFGLEEKSPIKQPLPSLIHNANTKKRTVSNSTPDVQEEAERFSLEHDKVLFLLYL